MIDLQCRIDSIECSCKTNLLKNHLQLVIYKIILKKPCWHNAQNYLQYGIHATGRIVERL
jgi:hypothetical protein